MSKNRTRCSSTDIILWISIILAPGYLLISLFLFHFFAPSKITVLGIGISISSFNRPFKSSAIIVLVGFILGLLANRRRILNNNSIVAVIYCAVLVGHLST
jgi:hypothetical protein